MPIVDVVVESDISLSARCHQVCGMFDCPPEKRQRLEWKCNVAYEDRPWSVGLIVGPSGCGKTTIAKSLFPNQITLRNSWDDRSLIDNFDKANSIADISSALSSVGFSTIPAWLRPYSVLSNGEKFRADIARLIVSNDQIIVVDEFSSVVDRQVAKIVSNSIQKVIRKGSKKFVAVSCHTDIEDWLQPDWIFEPAKQEFRWRLLRQRPPVQIEMGRLPYEAWRMFAPYHYLTASLNPAARCFGLWADGTLAAFAGVLHRPNANNKKIKGISRMVTLPDWQGLGLAFVLMETIGSAHTALGNTLNMYPAHPSFAKAFRKENWTCKKQLGKIMTLGRLGDQGRPCAVFSYVGEKMDKSLAQKFVS